MNIGDTLVALPRARGWVTKLIYKLRCLEYQHAGRSKQNMCPDIFLFCLLFILYPLVKRLNSFESFSSLNAPTYLPPYLLMFGIDK